MKKHFIFVALLILMLSLTGCFDSAKKEQESAQEHVQESAQDISQEPTQEPAEESEQEIEPEEEINTLKGWMFQHNEGTNDYSLFFGLWNADNEYIAADVDVFIRIENDKEDVVYTAQKSVTKDDFDYYSMAAEDDVDRFLAEIRIPEEDITEGKSPNGKVYLTVYQYGVLLFDEVNCEAYDCLPVLDVELETDPLPLKIKVKGFSASDDVTYKIQDVTFEYNKDSLGDMEIVVSGKKIKDKSEYSSNVIPYKIYDCEGYVVDSGHMYVLDIDEGDLFREEIDFYDVVPGEKYKIVFGD